MLLLGIMRLWREKLVKLVIEERVESKGNSFLLLRKISCILLYKFKYFLLKEPYGVFFSVFSHLFMTVIIVKSDVEKEELSVFKGAEKFKKDFSLFNIFHQEVLLRSLFHKFNNYILKFSIY